MAAVLMVGALQQLRTDQGRGFRCPRPGQHQRVLSLLASVPLPLSQDGAGHAEAAMEFAIESEAVKGTAIDFLRLCLADRTTDPQCPPFGGTKHWIVFANMKSSASPVGGESFTIFSCGIWTHDSLSQAYQVSSG